MILTEAIKYSIEKSVLCWLATSNKENIPNVSPKEIFACYENDHIIIANIASPQTVKNIAANHNVCLSFIDILLQKGYQLKGAARIVTKNDSEFQDMNLILQKMTQGKFPYASITAIQIKSSKEIVAPRYLLYPDTKEEDQIAEAKKLYGLD